MTLPLWARGRLRATLAIAACLAGLIGLAPSLAHLRGSRATAEGLVHVMARPLAIPAALIAPDSLVIARDADQARAILRQRLRDISVREGVLIETLADAPEAGPAAAVALSVSGDQAHVLRFAEAVENRTPVIRFASWRIEAAGSTASLLRLQATAILVWGPRP